LQPFADAFKLIFKETIVPGLSNIVLFIIAPIFTFALSLVSWSVLPFSYGLVVSDINLGLMFIFSISSLGVYGIVISGWSSNSKYAFLGSLRSAAQFISYEVVMAVTIMSVILCVGSLNITSIIQMQSSFWFILAFWPSFLMFFISSLAETNRIPFDLPEAESELVSGYNVEYAATTFVLFFLAEYSNILIMSVLIVLFFFGGWHLFVYIPFLSYWFVISFKVICVVILFILIRATLPRYRYDNLMNVGWKVLLPISLIYFVFTAFYFFIFNVTFIF
jgi:NADH-quinone oxidoreductase subunit H